MAHSRDCHFPRHSLHRRRRAARAGSKAASGSVRPAAPAGHRPRDRVSDSCGPESHGALRGPGPVSTRAPGDPARARAPADSESGKPSANTPRPGRAAGRGPGRRFKKKKTRRPSRGRGSRRNGRRGQRALGEKEGRIPVDPIRTGTICPSGAICPRCLRGRRLLTRVLSRSGERSGERARRDMAALWRRPLLSG